MIALGDTKDQRTVAADDPGERVHDCVVVGGGIAGLTAAWSLRDRDVLLLESGPRVGGRVRSEKRGCYWLSVGAHMFPEPDSIVGRMVDELELETLRINGDLLGVWMDGKLVRGGRPETYPLRLPLDRRARFDMVTSGVEDPTRRRRVRALGQCQRRRPLFGRFAIGFSDSWMIARSPISSAESIRKWIPCSARQLIA